MKRQWDIVYVNSVEPLPIPGGRRFFELHSRLSKYFDILYVQPYSTEDERVRIARELDAVGIDVLFLKIPVDYTKNIISLYAFRAMSMAKILKVLKPLESKFEILHEEASPYPLFSKALIRIKKKTLLTIHEVRGLLSLKILGIAGIAEYTLEKCLSLLKSTYDHIITVSNSTRSLAKSQLGIDSVLIPNGVDVHKFHPSINKKFNEDIIKILTIGRLIYHKGYFQLPYLIRMFKNILRKHPNLKIKYYVIGKGPYEQYISKLFRNVKHNRLFLIHLKNLSEQEYISTIQSGDIYLHLNPYMEGFGFTVAEASSCGIPIIAFNIPGVRDLVVNSETGFLIPPFNYDILAQRIEQLIVNKELRTKMGVNARKRIEQLFSWELSVKKLKKLYSFLMFVTQ